MITIGYYHGANRELEEKTGYKHGQKLYNSLLHEIINKVIKSNLNIMITHKHQKKHPYHNYIIYIDDDNFK